jgi:hypothetical protein
MAKKGENVYTGVDDAEWLSKGFSPIKSAILVILKLCQ